MGVQGGGPLASMCHGPWVRANAEEGAEEVQEAVVGWYGAKAVEIYNPLLYIHALYSLSLSTSLLAAHTGHSKDLVAVLCWGLEAPSFILCTDPAAIDDEGGGRGES